MTADCSEKALRKVPIFYQIVLKPLSFCFIILTETWFTNIFGISKEKNFEVLDNFSTMLYNINTYPRTATTDFPQRYSSITILAEAGGDHPNKFQPSFPTGDGNNTNRLVASNEAATYHDQVKKWIMSAPISAADNRVELYCSILGVLLPDSGIF